MSTPSSVLRELLLDLRQHPAFPELINQIQASPLPPYRPSRSGNSKPIDVVGADHAWNSGRVTENERILAILQGVTQESSQ